MIDDSMKEIVNDFVQEALELLESLNENFVELEKDPGNKDLLNTIFRAAHTIKGSAGFLGFQSIVELAHSAENILNKLRQGEIFLTSGMMDCLLEAMDILKAMIISVSKTGIEGLTPVDNAELIKRLDDMAEGIIGLREEESKQPEAKGTQAVRQNLPHSAAENGKVLAEKEEAAGEIINEEKHKENRAKTDKRKVRNLGDILLEDNLISKEELEQIYKEKEEEIKQPETGTFEQKQERNRQAVPIQEVPKPPQTEAALPGPKPSPARTPEIKETTIRVDIDRLDNVMNLVGELVLARNRLFNISSKLEMKYAGDDLSSALAQVVSNLNLVTTDLQLAVMKTRMQPVKKVFSKFPRMVRDLSRELGKEIELQISGEETELDKSVIEEIGDPLVHLIRNSVDHGVETKEMRKRLGKPEIGTIKLSAEHEGNYIVISVSDDGKGMDPSS